MSEETPKRKAEHIKICLEEKAQAKQATTGFADVHFVHRALPEIDKQKIDLSTYLFGHKFNAPIIVEAMTGGTAEAEKINANIAIAVEKLGLGMGVGSQRAAVENPKQTETFTVTRKKAPNAFLIANIGGVQLVHGYGVREVKKAVEMIDADAVAIHLNALQEAVQPEGQTNFEGILEKICEVAGELDVPVIVKETGCGISAEEAKKLEAAGVQAIDVGGLGGTSFAAVEYFRTEEDPSSVEHFLGEVFWDWGIPTAVSLAETTQAVKIPVVASGGIRDGSEVAKALAFGASLTGLAQPVLEAANKGALETESLLSLLIEELQNVMFLVGAQNTLELVKAPLVIRGETGRWLKIRGIDIKGYAKRGAK
ncbi:MAG: type 2 isopentenyl-diphosphate Delta-isomerase [Candidatus Bathyarchaeota archaeon]|nr:type 2 isopentenyl-diphosphate Delta-isomerase [Candidatus Bathyarchaeota archaeon]